jgi:hypothetical protein
LCIQWLNLAKDGKQPNFFPSKSHRQEYWNFTCRSESSLPAKASRRVDLPAPGGPSSKVILACSNKSSNRETLFEKKEVQTWLFAAPHRSQEKIKSD